MLLSRPTSDMLATNIRDWEERWGYRLSGGLSREDIGEKKTAVVSPFTIHNDKLAQR